MSVLNCIKEQKSIEFFDSYLISNTKYYYWYYFSYPYFLFNFTHYTKQSKTVAVIYNNNDIVKILGYFNFDDKLLILKHMSEYTNYINKHEVESFYNSFGKYLIFL